METWSNQSTPTLHGRWTELLMKVNMRPSLEEASLLQSVAQESSHTCVQRDLTQMFTTGLPWQPEDWIRRSHRRARGFNP